MDQRFSEATKAQRIVKERINIFAELAAEYRNKAEPGKGDWKFELVMQADAITRELRDVFLSASAIPSKTLGKIKGRAAIAF